MKSPCGCTKLDIWSLFDSLVLVICFSFKSSHMVGRASQGTCECLLSAAVYICQRSFNYFSSAKVHVSSPERFRIPISFNNGLNILCSSLLRFFVWGEIAIFSVSIQEVSNGSRSTELKWVVFIYFFWMCQIRFFSSFMIWRNCDIVSLGWNIMKGDPIYLTLQ